jgi:hypothetical protein
LKIYNATPVTMKAVVSMKYMLLPPGTDVIADVVKPSRVWRREMMLCAVETRMCKIHEA